MSYIRTPDGYYFQKTTTGLKPIDQRTLQSLMSSGTNIPTESWNDTYATMNSPTAPAAQVQQPTNPMAGGAPMTGQSDTQTPGNDPLTKFNFALMDMLSKAQGTAGQEKLVERQTALQRAMIGRQKQMTPEEMRVLSPGQQSAIRSGKMSALTPEIDAVNNQMKSRDMRLQNFERILGQMKDIGADIAKLSPSKEVIEGYRQAMKAGVQPSADVLASIGKYLTAEDWSAFTAANKSSSGGSGTNQMTDNERALQTVFQNNPIVKNFNELVAKKMSIEAIIDSGVGGPGDLAVVYEFMKSLDPSSVVRETEYATAAKSGNIFAGAFARFNGYLKESGGFLPSNVKDSFKSIINSKLQVSRQLYDNYAQQTRDIASRQGLNPQNVVIDFSAALGSPTQSTAVPNQSVETNKPIYAKDPATGNWIRTN